jgi:hypothetical protein
LWGNVKIFTNDCKKHIDCPVGQLPIRGDGCDGQSSLKRYGRYDLKRYTAEGRSGTDIRVTQPDL